MTGAWLPEHRPDYLTFNLVSLAFKLIVNPFARILIMIEQIRRDVAQLCISGSRMVGSRGHGNAAEYLIHRLTELEVEEYSSGSFELPYAVGGFNGTNIVGRIVGTDPELLPVLIGAHYDTCGDQPGADDNAAGIAAVLSAARPLIDSQIERTVLLAFFDAEEPPYFLSEAMGSIRFFEDQLSEPVHCAIILDLVGHDVPVRGLEDLLFITGMESDPGLESVVQDGQTPDGLRVVPTLNAYVGDLSDHFIFRSNNKPYLLLTCGRWDHYHAATDTPDRLNYRKTTAISQYICTLTKAVAHAGLNGPFEGYDTTDAELYSLRKTVLSAIKAMGLDVELQTRNDINDLVRILVQKFGL